MVELPLMKIYKQELATVCPSVDCCGCAINTVAVTTFGVAFGAVEEKI
jgi:hypothetical protein